MNEKSHRRRFSRGWLVLWVFVLGAFLYAPAHAQSTYVVNVVDQAGAPVAGFRWLLQEDTDKEVTPGVYQPPDDTIRLSTHRSYAPVVSSGQVTGSSVTINVPSASKRYFVSILPFTEHALGAVSLAGSPTTKTVVCQAHPLPTAQISVQAFRDIHPINNAWDVGESGIPGFQVKVYDQFGEMFYDAFGNTLGTTYVTNPDGSVKLDAEGNPTVKTPGNGITTNVDGLAYVKNLYPGKYGIRVVPRTTSVDGQSSINPNRWTQTATIEGTPTVDAWVGAGNGPFFVEFGVAFYHISIGFVLTDDPIVKGNPSTGIYNGLDQVPNPTGAEGTITGRVINVHQSRPPATALNSGVVVPDAWVGLNLIEGGTGQGVYTRQANPNDGTFQINGVPPGTYQLVVWDTPLNQIVSFHTVIVPAGGGTVNMGDVAVNAWFGRLEGNIFFDDDEDGFLDPGEKGVYGQAVNLRFRDGTMYQATATGLDGSYTLDGIFPWFHWIVTEVDFARFKATGATFVVDDGGQIPPDNGWAMPSEDKRNPQPQASINPNTGNNLSRTETGPVITQAMLLYADQNHRIDWGKKVYGPGPDGEFATPDDENGGISGIVFYDSTRAEDDPRFNAGETWQPGIPQVRVNLYRIEGRDENDKPNQLTMINSTLTDGWDSSMPSECPGDPQFDPFGAPIDSCAEYLRTWNQLRPGVFDGGYAFEDHYPGGIQVGADGNPLLNANGDPIPVNAGEDPVPLPIDHYVVQVVSPKGYVLVKEEDKNVDFGDRMIPDPHKLPPVCVGDDHLVPDELSLVPGSGIAPFYAGETRPLCDKKEVVVSSQLNAAADFFLFTYVPVAGHFVGLNTNDLTNTFSPKDPNFGEKLFPSWIPISFQDYKGNEVVRTYTDEWGGYNALVPGSFTANVPNPSGFSPNMMNICLNDPGEDLSAPDPFYNPAYGVVCYTFDAWPGKTVLLDTPVLPVAAFTASYRGRLDCELPSGTPRIKQVINGPVLTGNSGTQVLDIRSVGSVKVANPNYRSDLPPGTGNQPTITRDYGFGATRGSGTVKLNGTNLTVLSWNNSQIRVQVNRAAVSTGQLIITRGNGRSSPVGITVHKMSSATTGIRRVPSQFPTIQSAIDAANAGDLILVAPGTYVENVIMWKPVRLQGYGEGGTIINGFEFTPEVKELWLAKVNFHVTTGQVSLVPGQRRDFFLEAGAGVTVLGKNNGSFTNARIDGFTITQSILAGAIFVNGYTNGLNISNNRIASNYGNFAGGIRVGWASDGTQIPEAANQNLYIHHNHLNQNGSMDGGGGIALFNDSDNYRVEDCYVCGNFSAFAGAGIHHRGQSPGGRINKNKLYFNEVFTGDRPRGGWGGGVLIAGEEPVAGVPLTPGAGSVTVTNNLIQGNAAGHDGGGIAALRFNGSDANTASEFLLSITGNTIVNNVAQMAGGAISLNDVENSVISNNRMARNDSTATHQDAFATAVPLVTTNQIAGVFSRLHSDALQAITGNLFSKPTMAGNIIWQNRSFHYDDTQADPLNGVSGLLPRVAPWDYRNLGVEGNAGTLTCTGCTVSNTGTPFVSPYYNTLEAANAADEGGNSLTIILRPLTPTGNYSLR